MVVAGKNAAYGTAEQNVPVKGNLMVIQTLPRTLGTNESVELPVTLFNGRDKAQTVTVDITAEGAIKTSASQKIDVPAMADKTITFRLDTAMQGMARVTVRASAASGETAAASVTEIDVLPRGTMTATARRFTLARAQPSAITCESRRKRIEVDER